MFCQLLKQAAGNHAPCAQGFHLCHSYGQPSPEVSLLLYQFGILIARSFVTWLALAFQPDCFIHLCRLSPSKVLRLYYFTAGMCKLREIHNRKSSPRTDTVFCACSLNCQRAVSVRKRLEKACSLTNFIITLNFTYFKAIFLPNAPYFSNISSYLIMGITALHFMYNLHKVPLNLLHCLQYCSLHL